MQHHFHEQWTQIREQEDTYVLATVVAVRGSSSAKPGSRAIISKDGKNLWGWIGGGCAESFLIKASLEALKTRQSCVVTVDLDDELLGVGMPCGGYMDVFLEPILPATNLVIAGDSPITGPLAALGSRAGYAVTVQHPNARLSHCTRGANKRPGQSGSKASIKPYPGDWINKRSQCLPLDL